MPTLRFRPTVTICQCGAPLKVRKTHGRSVATLVIGHFHAHLTQLVCWGCDRVFNNEELKTIVPTDARFGFDVMVHIGTGLFLKHQNRLDIQRELDTSYNVRISPREIDHLGRLFIVYLSITHQQSQEPLKQFMLSQGGYILHLDGTCEGDSPHLISSIDGLSRIVLGNVKVPSENAQQISTFLRTIQQAYGDPIALVHDMGGPILKAVADVFPGLPDYVCHFHFLRDLGKDLLQFEYNSIRRYLKNFKTYRLLRQAARELRHHIQQDAELNNRLIACMKNKEWKSGGGELPTSVTQYLLVTWVLESRTNCHGYGFPFDRAHLDFCDRLRECYPHMKAANERVPAGVPRLPIAALSRVLADPALNQTLNLIRDKIILFDELRQAMRIALPLQSQGLKDEGDQQAETIEARVKAFRHSDRVNQLASQHIAYRKMVGQIDRYWDKLFADPIEVETENGSLSIQPQRTNNLLETFFRDLKHDYHKKTGTSSLSKVLTSMLANTPLVKNLNVPKYVEIILAGHATLAERFAEIDIAKVRELLSADDESSKKYPTGMARLFKTPDLPAILAKVA